jgi:hypothetical protein
VLNGAQGMSEIVTQIIGQAGPAMKFARETLGTTGAGGSTPGNGGGANGAPPSNGAG